MKAILLQNNVKRVKLNGRRLIRMPLKPRTKEEKYTYDQQYLKDNILTVGITFNKRKPEDMALLDWLNDRDEKKVAYIKRLLREDMERFT